ncbi:RloB family protein [Candidatus Chloroploca asiatica]|uniref:RloB domain-containing protein n=1 Tax=Candidatus Chloroploca asiatica TaxID=1506545 RepID=A0A2H3KYE6_9CHLR|nr:RloB family protein [Candidatus Chloroploca asiatica]PDV97381.1 hypothetical protein A9Q02_18680 [Candidatus Chloroploca asiatica]
MPKPKQPKSKTKTTDRALIGLDALARRPGTKIHRPVLIVCEGKKTEQIYLNALRQYYRLSTIDLHIHGEGAGPLEVVERALELMAERRKIVRKERDLRPYAEIWCVFDREAANEPVGYREALQLAAQHNIALAVSNPAFEYWYLLHFVETSRAFQNADEVKAELCKPNCLPGYQKQKNVFNLIHERTDTAHDRAERLYERHPDRERDPHPNPSTLIYRLVAGIIAMARF